MSRRKVVPFPADEGTKAVVRLGRLLDMIASVAPVTYSQEALERAGFVTDDRPLDPFRGRRILAEIDARERRRHARLARHRERV